MLETQYYNIWPGRLNFQNQTTGSCFQPILFWIPLSPLVEEPCWRSLSQLKLASYLLHISKGDGLGLVAGVVPAVSSVPSEFGDPSWRLSQSVEEGHLFSQAQGAHVRFSWTWTWLLSLHHWCWFGGLEQGVVQNLLRGDVLLRGCLQAEEEAIFRRKRLPQMLLG